MHITLKQLSIFEAVAKHKNYTKAAKSLFLTQPAVSMQMKQLEEAIGLPLLERTGKEVRTTLAGEELRRYARRVMENLDELEGIIDEIKGLKRGRLHLTMASTANYFTPRLVADFHHRYPGAQVTLDVTNRTGLLRALDENSTDMVIMGQPPEGHDLTGIPFMDNPLVVIAAPVHPLAGCKNIPLAEIANEPFIVREQHSGTRMAAERFFDRHDLELSACMEMNRSEAVKQAVMAELGLGILSLHTLEMELALNRLVILDIQGFPIMRQWFIVHRNGKRFAAIPEAFRDFVLKNAQALLTLPEYTGLD